MNKKIVYIDMDGVIVDFGKFSVTDWFDKHPHLVDRYKGFPDHIQGLFRIGKPIDGLLMLSTNYMIVVNMTYS